MSAILSNFLTTSQTRGDILSPASYRSVIEMIQGLLSQYDFGSFSQEYKAFLAHLVDYNDPHEVTSVSFTDEIIETTYGIYTNMTATPVTLDVFKTSIVPSVGFIELLRRIVLNRFLYDKVKRPEGTVPASVSIRLGEDWIHGGTNGPITLTFGAGINSETDFIKLGWGANTSPIATIFNANDLNVTAKNQHIVFHTSRVSPYFLPTGITSNYTVGIYGSTNDFTVRVVVVNAPAAKTGIFSMTNGTDTLLVSMNPDRSLELVWNGQTITSTLACMDGEFYLTTTSTGTVSVDAANNGTITKTSYMLDFSNVTPFVSATVIPTIESFFQNSFGLRELTILKDNSYLTPTTEIIPYIKTVEASTIAPVASTASANGFSTVFSATPGYKLYLTLTGTWTGSVSLLRSTDGGFNWNQVTHQDGVPVTITQNCDESLTMVTQADVKYRLEFAVASGTIIYRLAQ